MLPLFLKCTILSPGEYYGLSLFLLPFCLCFDVFLVGDCPFLLSIRSPKVHWERSVEGRISRSFSLVPPSAIPFLWRTLQTPASWWKLGLALDVCTFHSISIFHLGPHPHNERIPTMQSLCMTCKVTPEKMPPVSCRAIRGPWLCGARIGATSYINPSILSLTSTTSHGAQHLASPVSETFRILHGKMACCMLLQLPQPAFHYDLPLFFEDIYLPFLHPISAFVCSRWDYCPFLVSLRMKSV